MGFLSIYGATAVSLVGFLVCELVRHNYAFATGLASLPTNFILRHNCIGGTCKVL